MKRLALLFFTFLPIIAGANQRKFSYTYETNVLPLNSAEIEVWGSFRSQKDYFFQRYDQRLEFEYGLGNNLQVAFYLNSSFRSEDDNKAATGGALKSSQSNSISSEWKWKFTDRVADVVGSAVYAEYTIGIDNSKLEGKVFFDKQVEDYLFAFNAVYERAWKVGSSLTTTYEDEFEFDLAGAYSPSPNYSFGLEMRNHNYIIDNKHTNSALFFGPSISYATKSGWFVFSVLPQIKNLKSGQSLDFSKYEKLLTRLLFSIDI
ncbi:MAG: hypothetical protein O3A55_05285 [Bacteroidetes bacterium]|nr:hypothetical protein [Bacteroidota bacterium]